MGVGRFSQNLPFVLVLVPGWPGEAEGPGLARDPSLVLLTTHWHYLRARDNLVG